MILSFQVSLCYRIVFRNQVQVATFIIKTIMNTPTPNLGLNQIGTSDRQWDVPTNANLVTLDALAPIGNLAVRTAESPSATLNVNISAGSFIQAANTIFDFVAVTGYAVAASSTVYLWLTDAGVLTTGTAFPTGTAIVRLAIVTTGATTITAVKDARVTLRSASHS